MQCSCKRGRERQLSTSSVRGSAFVTSLRSSFAIRTLRSRVFGIDKTGAVGRVRYSCATQLFLTRATTATSSSSYTWQQLQQLPNLQCLHSGWSAHRPSCPRTWPQHFIRKLLKSSLGSPQNGLKKLPRSLKNIQKRPIISQNEQIGAKFLAIAPQTSLRGPILPYLRPIQKTYNGLSGKLEYIVSVDL